MPTTTHLGLSKFATSTSNWGDAMNNNLDAIDTAIFEASGGAVLGNSVTIEAAVTISAYLAVALIASKASPADKSDANAVGNVIGIATAGTVSGAGCPVQIYGAVTFNGWSWTIGLPVFVGSAGLLTQTPPISSSALFSQVIGVPIAADTLLIQIQAPVELA